VTQAPVHKKPPQPIVRWPPLLATLGAAGCFLALPRSLRAGPPWIWFSGLGILVGATIIARRRDNDRLNQIFGVSLLVLLTMVLCWSVGALVWTLPEHLESPQDLVRSAVLVWCSNVLVFASWYWRLDGGGPNVREDLHAHEADAFLFPQLQGADPQPNWRAGFVDYLFLAFTTSTAFSPTDTPVLSRWGKVAMMCQATVSFIIVAVLVAHAVSII
jgi:uncharacterized membrane protein